MSYNYSIKARALIHAHLTRLTLKPDTLDLDRMYIVKKCPYLIQEMVGVVSQLILLAYAQRGLYNEELAIYFIIIIVLFISASAA